MGKSIPIHECGYSSTQTHNRRNLRPDRARHVPAYKEALEEKKNSVEQAMKSISELKAEEPLGICGPCQAGSHETCAGDCECGCASPACFLCEKNKAVGKWDGYLVCFACAKEMKVAVAEMKGG